MFERYFTFFDQLGRLKALHNRRVYHLPGQHDQADHGNWSDGDEDNPGPRGRMLGVESAMRRNKAETAIVYDSAGREIYRQAGNERQVQFTEYVIRRFKDGVFTHNHPSGSGLSGDDMRFAAQADVAEMRAVGENSFGKFTFIMKKPKEGWPPLKYDDYRQSMTNVVDEMQNKVFHKFNRRIEEGTLSIAEANQTHWLAVAALVAKKIGAEYRTIRISPRKISAAERSRNAESWKGAA